MGRMGPVSLVSPILSPHIREPVEPENLKSIAKFGRIFPLNLLKVRADLIVG